MAIVPGRIRVVILTNPPADMRAPTAAELRDGIDLPPLDFIDTYGWMPAGKGDELCLATRWYDSDPQPFICARKRHLPRDDRHLTLKYAGYAQTMWREGE